MYKIIGGHQITDTVSQRQTLVCGDDNDFQYNLVMLKQDLNELYNLRGEVANLRYKMRLVEEAVAKSKDFNAVKHSEL
tara:strand:+ start:47 stop:280 length:234 start_codon:yes stop_codon:yes gene_type:complete